jgi:prevent-host-death family protein
MKALRARTGARKRSPGRRRKPLPRELNIGEAKALFSQLVDEAARGASFVIAKAGTPVARIVPLEAEPKKIVFGTMKGLLSPEEEEALLKAIEAPLPDDVLASFYAKRLEGPE